MKKVHEGGVPGLGRLDIGFPHRSFESVEGLKERFQPHHAGQGDERARARRVGGARIARPRGKRGQGKPDPAASGERDDIAVVDDRGGRACEAFRRFPAEHDHRVRALDLLE